MRMILEMEVFVLGVSLEERVSRDGEGEQEVRLSDYCSMEL